jgi:hypothetical protein
METTRKKRYGKRSRGSTMTTIREYIPFSVEYNNKRSLYDNIVNIFNHNGYETYNDYLRANKRRENKENIKFSGRFEHPAIIYCDPVSMLELLKVSNKLKNKYNYTFLPVVDEFQLQLTVI